MGCFARVGFVLDYKKTVLIRWHECVNLQQTSFSGSESLQIRHQLLLLREDEFELVELNFEHFDGDRSGVLRISRAILF